METPTTAQDSSLEARLATLQAELEALKSAKVAKNKVAGKPDANRKYRLLSKSLDSWGKVPQQQADIATILSSNFEVGQEVSEVDLFAKITECAPNFPSLANSKQDPTYVFRYYRGLPPKGKHAGFIARDFLVHN